MLQFVNILLILKSRITDHFQNVSLLQQYIFFALVTNENLNFAGSDLFSFYQKEHKNGSFKNTRGIIKLYFPAAFHKIKILLPAYATYFSFYLFNLILHIFKIFMVI